MASLYKYRAFGLNILSQLVFPEMEEAEFRRSCTDVEISSADSRGEHPVIFAQGGVDVRPRVVTMTIAGVGKYRVTDGREILIHQDQNVKLHDLRLYVLGTCFGVLLHQRGVLPLHGCGLKGKRGGVVFCGDSGIGKSTLSMALAGVGYPLLSDDVCTVTVENGRPLLWPSYPQVKVCEDMCFKLDLDLDGLEKHEETGKYYLPVEKYYFNSVEPLVAVVCLRTSKSTPMELVEEKGGKKHTELVRNTFRIEYLPELGCTESHFFLCNSVASSIPIYSLNRPEGSSDPAELARFIVQSGLLGAE